MFAVDGMREHRGEERKRGQKTKDRLSFICCRESNKHNISKANCKEQHESHSQCLIWRPLSASAQLVVLYWQDQFAKMDNLVPAHLESLLHKLLILHSPAVCKTCNCGSKRICLTQLYINVVVLTNSCAAFRQRFVKSPL